MSPRPEGECGRNSVELLLDEPTSRSMSKYLRGEKEGTGGIIEHITIHRLSAENRGEGWEAR